MNDYYETEGDSSHGPSPARTRPMRDRDVRGIGERVDALDKALHIIGEQVERAGEQLSPMLRPEPPSPAFGEVRGGDEVESELSARLYRLTSHADRLGRNLRDLLDRVDL